MIVAAISVSKVTRSHVTCHKSSHVVCQTSQISEVQLSTTNVSNLTFTSTTMATEKIHMCFFAKVQRPQFDCSGASGSMYDYIVRSSLPQCQ